MTRIVLLPGMDGTGELFRGFAEAAPADCTLQVHPLPAEPIRHAELARRMGNAMRLDGECVLVAESYSGALAMRLAAEHPLRALVLVNSFVAPPRPRALRLLAQPVLFRLTPPRAIIRHLLVGRGARAGLMDEVRAAIARTPPPVLAARMAEVLDADASEWLARCTMPILYLRGAHDRLVSERSVRRIASIRSVRIARLSAPHLLLQVVPAEAWNAIGAFLTDISCSSAEETRG